LSLWFTSDTHFGHENIIQYCNRPFASVQEMDEKLIENWNHTVKPDETIYHLGDFTLAGGDTARVYFQRLDGKINVVPGGHDWKWLREEEYYSRSGHRVTILPPLHTIKVPHPDQDAPQHVVLCHYAMRVWDRSHYGSWHLYGHSHGNLPPLENSLDVGVDNWGYQPLSLKKIEKEITG